MKQRRTYRNRPPYLWPKTFNEEAKIIQWRKASPQQMSEGQMDIHMEVHDPGSYSKPGTKLAQNGSKTSTQIFG